MKPVFLFVVAATVACGGIQARKLDMGSLSRLRAMQQPVQTETSSKARLVKRVQAPAADPVLNFFVTLAPGADVSALTALGAEVDGCRGSMALVRMPKSLIESVEALPQVKSISLSRPVRQKMDVARELTGINKIHAGTDIEQPYTGKGVVCGIVDGGIDPNHVNFIAPDGTSRIGRFTYYRPTQSGDYVEEIHDRDYIPVIDTEDATTFHGTHTLGIMAGSYKGNLTAAVPTGEATSEPRTIANPYYGIATDADLAVACGALDDYHIALGAETILNYAYDLRKPAVINLSLGSNLGPHDGSSTICRYLDACAQQDAVVFCVSAGNEGTLPIALTRTFSDSETSVRTLLRPIVEMENYQNVRYGQTYINSDSPEKFQVQVLLVNEARPKVPAGRLVYDALADGETAGSQYWVSSSDYVQGETDVVHQQLGKWFEGYIGVGSEFDAVTGRYYAVVDYMLWDNTTGTSANADGKYKIGLMVEGSPGQKINIYCDGIYNDLNAMGIAGYVDGSSNGSISDVACGNNYVVVGSYNNRAEYASLDGGIYTFEESNVPGEISDFSSYGELYDGRVRPTVCAPGTAVISSSNQYYLEAANVEDKLLQATLEQNGRKYSWHQSTGTSMATPVVAGSIALWMEADPSLRYDDVLDIIARTAHKDEQTASTGNPIQWGAGKFDAYAGLKEVIRRKLASVGDVSADASDKLLLSFDANGDGRVLFADASEFTVSVYNATGARVASASGSGCEAVVPVSGLPKGVYILGIDGTPVSCKFCVK